MLLHLLLFDVKTMHYVLQSTVMGLPVGRGYVRRYTRSVFSPDFQFLFAATTVGDVAVFSVANSVFRAGMNIGASGCLAVVAKPGGILFAGSGDGFVKKFQGADLQWVQQAECHLPGRVLSLCLVADGEQLVATTDTGKMYRIRCSDLTHLEVAETLTAPLTAVAFGRRSDLVATFAESGVMRLWDLSDYQTVAQYEGNGAPGRSLHFTKDGSAVLCGYADGRLSAWSVGEGAESWQVPAAHRGNVACITANDKVVVTGGDEGCLRFWLKDSRKLITQLNPHKKPVVSVALDVVHPTHVLSAGSDKTCTIFDLKTESRATTHQLTDGGNITAMCQRLDSESEAITATNDGRIMFWDIDVHPDPVAVIIDESRAKINCMVLSPSGRYLATAWEDGLVKVHSVQALSLVVTLAAHAASVSAVAWSPDQRQLVSVGLDGAICVWNFYLD